MILHLSPALLTASMELTHVQIYDVTRLSGRATVAITSFSHALGDLVLVEDTQLRAEVLRKQNDFGYLEQDIRTQHIEKLICDENALKVYGSLFVLCRFLSRRITSDMSLDIDTIRFWLVVNNDQQDNAMALNEITWLLRQNLRAELGKTIVGDVEVMAREFLLKNMKARLCKSRHIYI